MTQEVVPCPTCGAATTMAVSRKAPLLVENELGPEFALVAVAWALGRTLIELQSNREDKDLVRDRRLAMRLLESWCNPAPTQRAIALSLKKDESTVWAGLKKARILDAEDADFLTRFKSALAKLEAAQTK